MISICLTILLVFIFCMIFFFHIALNHLVLYADHMKRYRSIIGMKQNECMTPTKAILLWYTLRKSLNTPSPDNLFIPN